VIFDLTGVPLRRSTVRIAVFLREQLRSVRTEYRMRRGLSGGQQQRDDMRRSVVKQRYEHWTRSGITLTLLIHHIALHLAHCIILLYNIIYYALYII